MSLSPGKYKYLAPPMPGNLDDNMGRGSKTEKSQNLASLDPGKLQVAVPDGARAEERGCLCIGESLRDRIGEILSDDGIPAITSIRMASRGTKFGAQVFISLQAEPASSAGGMNPGNTHTVSRAKPLRARTQVLDPSNDLMPQDDREMGLESPLDFIQFCVTDTAGRDSDQNLLRSRNRDR
jgi:hypothetical protein